ncbi:uncharacterized protein LOC128270166 [Anopheles cruzii]|uniref:uncharacterized protein LOC128270166 n=1 Tax=Anopheles cruzii TaxID=68878 RepID=UPI0022EC862A|nr:uncharacterized protein LOC128270166 [Anopheles cruzii]
MFLTITLLVTALTFIYFYLSWYSSYWTKRSVPGPAPMLLFGNFPSFFLRHRPFVEEFQKIYDKYRSRGNFVGVFNGRQPAIVLQNPSIIKDVLIKNFKNFQDNEVADSFNKETDPIFGRNPFVLKGEEWKQKRAEITPAFTSSRMKALFPLVEDVSQRMKQYIDRNTKQPIETREMCAKFTTDVVASCIFAADAQSFTMEKAEIREMGRKLLEPNFKIILMFILMGIVPALKKSIPVAFVPKSVEQFFMKLMKDAVEYREKNNIKRSDYLEHLVNLKAKKQLSILDMTAHGVTFFIDGFETSSLSMSFALYELARNPGSQTKLRNELLAARKVDGSIDYETLLELPYLDGVLNESLRLWPPLAFLSKVCTVPTEIELYRGKTVTIEQGIPVMIPLWCIHRDPEYFDDPQHFNPDRFAPEALGTALYRDKACLLPFGEGPRQCLGMRFALMQVKRGLFEVITKFEVSVKPKPIKLDPKTFIVCPKDGLWLDYKPYVSSSLKRTTVFGQPSTMFLTITLLATALTFIYVYLTWYHSYWTKRGVPGPTPMLLLGNFPSFILRNRPFTEEFQEIYDKYRARANFAGVFNGRQPAVLLQNATFVKDVLIKNFKNFQDNEFADSINKESDPIFGRNPFMLKGEEWKEKRAEVTPAFTTSRMKALFPFVEDVSQRMKQYIDGNTNQPIETREMCAKFTTDVVSSCIFAADAQSFTKEKAEIREMGRKLTDPSFRVVLIFLLIGIVPALKKLIPIAFVPKPVEQFFTKLMEDAVEYREKNHVKRSDYLEHLINLKAKKQISSLDMAAHGVTFFIDGFETSSLAMSFALYEVARNQAVQEKLRSELLQARNDDGSIEYDTLLELPYLDQVLSESLRLWPPAAFLSKVCTVPTELELFHGKTVSIERGMPVMIPVWCLQRDPEYYNDPECFNPDRFAPEAGGTKLYRDKGCYLPFGDGPRQCLGMRFALMQVKRGLFEVVTRYKLSVNSKTLQPLKLDPKAFITAPLNGCWLDYKPVTA